MLRANRERKRVIEQLDRGDLISAGTSLRSMHSDFQAMRSSPAIAKELELLAEKLNLLKSDPNRSRKRLSRESMRSSSIVWEEDDNKRL